MDVQSAQIDARTGPKRRRKRPLDRRTRSGKRVVELQAKLAAELGGECSLSDSQRLAIRHAAQMSAIAEALQQRQLAGDAAVDIDQVIRASNAAARAIAGLGIGRDKPAATHVPLRDRLLVEAEPT
jgi:hypothetical protein